LALALQIVSIQLALTSFTAPNFKTKSLTKTQIGVKVPSCRSNWCANFQPKRSTTRARVVQCNALRGGWLHNRSSLGRHFAGYLRHAGGSPPRVRAYLYGTLLYYLQIAQKQKPLHISLTGTFHRNNRYTANARKLYEPRMRVYSCMYVTLFENIPHMVFLCVFCIKAKCLLTQLFS